MITTNRNQQERIAYGSGLYLEGIMSSCGPQPEKKDAEEESTVNKAGWNKCMFGSFLSISQSTFHL